MDWRIGEYSQSVRAGIFAGKSRPARAGSRSSTSRRPAMTVRARSAISILIAAFASGPITVSALAAKPAKPSQVKGGSYSGGLIPASRGIRVSFKVSKDGRSVTALTISNTPLYCEGGGPATPIRFKNASISSNGTFKSTGRYVIAVGPLKGEVGTRLAINGRFLKGRREQGVLTTTYLKAPTCSGKSSYTTRA
jgi:hypothetical protein